VLQLPTRKTIHHTRERLAGAAAANQEDYPSHQGQAGRSCRCQPRRLSFITGTGWLQLQLPTRKTIHHTRDKLAGAAAANQEDYPSHQGQAGRSYSCQPGKTIHHTKDGLAGAETTHHPKYSPAQVKKSVQNTYAVCRLSTSPRLAHIRKCIHIGALMKVQHTPSSLYC
jgi:hypothetical protein